MSGTVVQVSYTKWGGAQHWTLVGGWLGEDEHGVWLGAAPGTRLSRPDRSFTATRHHVMLFPRAGAFTAAFYEPLPADRADEIAVYVDITTVPEWRGPSVSMVDLDLDVIGMNDGSVIVDDEDEFVAHQTLLGYPATVVDTARQSCELQLAAVLGRDEPFGTVGFGWLEDFMAEDSQGR